MAICAACGQDNPEGFKFCGACGASLEAAAAAREERKVVTVLFADLVGFTSRAERMDPKDAQSLVPALAESAFVSFAVGRPTEAEAFVDELLALDPVRNEGGPVLFHSFWVLRALGRTDELLAPLSSTKRETRWLAAARALFAGELVRAARMYGEAGALYHEAYAHLRAAEAGEPGAKLDKAIIFFRSVGATRYINEGEALLAAAS